MSTQQRHHAGSETSELALSPASRRARAATEVIERLYLEIETLRVEADRAKLTESFEASLTSLRQLAASAIDDAHHLEHLDAANAHLDALATITADASTDPAAVRMSAALREAHASMVETREPTIDAIVAIQNQLLDPETFSAPPPEPFLMIGSRGVPAVAYFTNRGLAAGVDVAAPELAEFERALADDAPDDAPDDGALVDLAEAAQGDTADFVDRSAAMAEDPLDELTEGQHALFTDPAYQAGPEGQLAGLRRIARDCMEEIGSLGNLRLLDDDELCTDGQPRFEQRLLNNLDALVALGRPFVGPDGTTAQLDVLSEVIAHARDRFVIDPMRAFARAFVLAASGRDDAMRASVLAFRQSHPAAHEAQIHAWALAPGESVTRALTDLCRDTDETMVLAALKTLWLRRQPALAATLPLLEHPSATIRSGAARTIAYGTPRAKVIEALHHVVQDDDERVLLAACESLARLDDPKAVELAREQIQDELDDPGMLAPDVRLGFLRLVARGGSEDDAGLLQRCLSHAVDEAEALGWHGHLTHLPVLLDALEAQRHAHPNTPFCRALVRALDRITGASQHDPDHAHLLSEGSTEVIAQRWRAWWEQHQERFDVAVRYRYGKPCCFEQTLARLAGHTLLQHERRWIAEEWSILSAGQAPIHVSDWIGQQAAQIEMARLAIGQCAVLSGDGRGKGLAEGPRLSVALNAETHPGET